MQYLQNLYDNPALGIFELNKDETKKVKKLKELYEKNKLEESKLEIISILNSLLPNLEIESRKEKIIEKKENALDCFLNPELIIPTTYQIKDSNLKLRFILINNSINRVLLSLTPNPRYSINEIDQQVTPLLRTENLIGIQPLYRNLFEMDSLINEKYGFPEVSHINKILELYLKAEKQ